MREPIRRLSAVAIAAVAAIALLLAGCGDDGGESDGDTTTTETERSSNDDDDGDSGASDEEARRLGARAFENAEFDIGEDGELCLGRTLIDEVGAERARTLVEEDDLAEMPDDDREVVREALNDCVPSEPMASGLIEVFTDEMRDVDTAELVECLTDHLDGRVGDTMVALARADESAAVAEVFGDCPTEDLLVAALTTGLAGSLDPAVVECVARKVAESTTLGEFMAARSDPALGEELSRRVEAAISACPG